MIRLIMLLIALAGVDEGEWGTRLDGILKESFENGVGFGHHYFSKEVTCPVCKHPFSVGILGSYTSSCCDLDFKVNAYISANPYLFRLWMCPECNYCAYGGDFNKEIDTLKMQKAIRKPKKYKSYFDIPYSDLLKRAIQCYAQRKFSNEEWGQLYLYGAWVARDSGQYGAQKKFHLLAQKWFKKSLQESKPTKVATKRYLISDIYRRYGKEKESNAWLVKAKESKRGEKEDYLDSYFKARAIEASMQRVVVKEEILLPRSIVKCLDLFEESVELDVGLPQEGEQEIDFINKLKFFRYRLEGMCLNEAGFRKWFMDQKITNQKNQIKMIYRLAYRRLAKKPIQLGKLTKYFQTIEAKQKSSVGKEK